MGPGDDLTLAQTLWPLSDHLNTPRDLATYNSQLNVTTLTTHRQYTSFGELLTQTGPHDTLFSFTGRLFDPLTGLQNNLNRWYNPSLGRWMSEDPIGFDANDANLYRYVGNGSSRASDPSGLGKGKAARKVIGVVVRAVRGSPVKVVFYRSN